MAAGHPRIPCGEASFRRIRTNGWRYVDKARYQRPLEEERYPFLIRPRRFGKSCRLPLHRRRARPGVSGAWFRRPRPERYPPRPERPVAAE